MGERPISLASVIKQGSGLATVDDNGVVVVDVVVVGVVVVVVDLVVVLVDLGVVVVDLVVVVVVLVVVSALVKTGTDSVGLAVVLASTGNAAPEARSASIMAKYTVRWEQSMFEIWHVAEPDRVTLQ